MCMYLAQFKFIVVYATKNTMGQTTQKEPKPGKQISNEKNKIKEILKSTPHKAALKQVITRAKNSQYRKKE